MKMGTKLWQIFRKVRFLLDKGKALVSFKVFIKFNVGSGRIYTVCEHARILFESIGTSVFELPLQNRRNFFKNLYNDSFVALSTYNAYSF